ncbi:MAG: hypothetical protein ACYCST_03610, partial [Acidimicrobiales bacterium]
TPSCIACCVGISVLLGLSSCWSLVARGGRCAVGPDLAAVISPPTSTTVARWSSQVISTWQPEGQLSNVAPLRLGICRAQHSVSAARVWSNDVVGWAAKLSRNC